MDMCIDMRIDMHIDMRIDIIDMCMDMCIDMCIDMCTDTCVDSVETHGTFIKHERWTGAAVTISALSSFRSSLLISAHLSADPANTYIGISRRRV